MKIKEPKDLNVKIVSKEEAAWTQIRDSAEKEIAQNDRMNILNEVIVKKAEEEIAKGKEK